jgi:hypothetical protein
MGRSVQRLILVTVALVLPLGCTSSSSSPAPAPALSVAKEPARVHLITVADHRGVVRLHVGDAVEIPIVEGYTYSAEVKEPSIFREDSPTHFTTIKAGQSEVLVRGDPTCLGDETCGRSRVRWLVMIIVSEAG